MKKCHKLGLICTIIVITILMCNCIYAEDELLNKSSGTWYREKGKWCYIDIDGNKLYNSVTPDEYWIGYDGFWVEESGIDSQLMSEKSNGGELIVFDKYSHQMELWINGERVYKCLGISGKLPGDKETEGDCKTPVGEFFVCTKNSNSQYHKSLGLSYPDIEDAERGIAQGIISEKQYKRIIEAIQNGSQPDWNTPLGGEIMIHGERAHSDLTRGCIGINNSDIDYIWDYINVGTKVIIQE